MRKSEINASEGATAAYEGKKLKYLSPVIITHIIKLSRTSSSSSSSNSW